MGINIKGEGCLVPASPVPDDVLGLAYPYFTVEDSPDGGLWLTLSPYIEVYDEDAVQSFLGRLSPYITRGTIVCTLKIAPGHAVEWSYKFDHGYCYRHHRCGSCTACSRVIA